jgi:hypothetical protein
MERIANQFFKTNIFLRPLCFIILIFITLTNQKTVLTSAFVFAFSLLLLLEGLLSLRYSKPSLTFGLKKLWNSEIPQDEKIKREIIIKRWHKFLASCGIASSVLIPYFWFFIM